MNKAMMTQSYFSKNEHFLHFRVVPTTLRLLNSCIPLLKSISTPSSGQQVSPIFVL
jgi:hypothetical protein